MTGLQVCKFVEGVFKNRKRCYALTCDSDGKNSLYELTLDDKYDLIKKAGTQDIEKKNIDCSVETRRFSFGDPFNVKELMRADVGFSDIQGPINWSLTYSPDFIPNFYGIQNMSIQNQQSTESLVTPSPPTLFSGYKLVRTVKPESICVGDTKRLSNFAYLFQNKISWTGQAKLILFKLHASRKDNSDLGECINNG